MSPLERRIEVIAERVQRSIRTLYEEAGVVDPSSPLGQFGLRDGINEVRDYLEHNERGLALEHLLYMIQETAVQVAEKDWQSLAAIAAKMGLTDLVEEIRPVA